MVSVLAWQTIVCEFESHWLPHIFGRVLLPSKKLYKTHQISITNDKDYVSFLLYFILECVTVIVVNNSISNMSSNPGCISFDSTFGQYFDKWMNSTLLTSMFKLEGSLSSIGNYFKKRKTGATTPGQSRPGIDSNEGEPRIPKSSCITGNSPSDCFVSYAGHFLRESYPLQRCSLCNLQPQLKKLGNHVLIVNTGTNKVTEWVSS